MPAVSDPTSLAALPLFENLPLEQLAWLNDILHATTVPAGTALMTVEQPSEVAYLILTGTVKVHVEQTNGMDVVLAIRGPGELVGEMSLVDSIGRSASVVTLEECSLLWIDRVAFQTCLQTIPAMTYNLARILTRRLRHASSQVQFLAARDVRGRVAWQLLSFAETYGQPVADGGIVIRLRLTQSDLAGMVGASRERVNKALRFYRQRGYLALNDGFQITILNQAALEQDCL